MARLHVHVTTKLTRSLETDDMLNNLMVAFSRRPITISICTYWMAFWLLNGLDKFLARKSLGVMTWYGNDRVEKFGMYFDRLAFPEAMIVPTLVFAGIVEIALAGMFLYALLQLTKQVPGAVRWADMAVALSVICFLGFATFDVMVGDRVELWEHSTYVGVLLISYLTMAAEVFFNHLQKETGSEKFSQRPSGNPLLDPAE